MQDDIKIEAQTRVKKKRKKKEKVRKGKSAREGSEAMRKNQRGWVREEKPKEIERESKRDRDREVTASVGKRVAQ